MKFINFIGANDAFFEAFDAESIEIIELGKASEAIEKIRAGESLRVLRNSFVLSGRIQSKRAQFALYDAETQIASIYICLHSRDSSALFSAMLDTAAEELPDMIPPSVPWVAMRFDANPQGHEDAIERLGKSLALALATE
jgi:hypothetical protein